MLFKLLCYEVVFLIDQNYRDLLGRLISSNEDQRLCDEPRVSAWYARLIQVSL